MSHATHLESLLKVPGRQRVHKIPLLGVDVSAEPAGHDSKQCPSNSLNGSLQAVHTLPLLVQEAQFPSRQAVAKKGRGGKGRKVG
eukprot:m.76722 g.76722  ORF g.76722 m.76722 type:complete len:85 (+) comp8522_c0_seq3:2284-2538(+)